MNRFKGFPPYEGFYQPYPAPNDQYWAGGYGNTQIATFKDMAISEVIVNPKQKHSNITVDSDIQIYRNGTIPAIGNIVEYSFLEGFDPQIVYNISPNSYGAYDAALGTNILAQSTDGTWVSQGVALDSANSEIVNATGVPIGLKRCTVIVVAAATNVSTGQTIVSNMPTSGDNGFAIDIVAGGGVHFRSRYGGVENTVIFPAATVSNGQYFMAALTFDSGMISGKVSGSNLVSAQFASYPNAPVATSDGWYFGKPAADYNSIVQSASLFKATKFGTNKYEQAAVSGTTVSLDYFNGILSYAIFYDRPLYDFELDFVYNQLSAKLLSERSITIS